MTKNFENQPDEFLDDQFETCNHMDAPEDEYYEEQNEYPYDEGSDRDNWEDNQVFLDGNDW